MPRMVRCDDCGRWTRPGSAAAARSGCRPSLMDTGVGTDPLQPGELDCAPCTLDHGGLSCEEAVRETQRLIAEIRREIEEKQRQCEMILRNVAAYGGNSSAAPPA